MYLRSGECDWAIGHLEQFPVEVTTADYHTLLRVPGIGVKSQSGSSRREDMEVFL